MRDNRFRRDRKYQRSSPRQLESAGEFLHVESKARVCPEPAGLSERELFEALHWVIDIEITSSCSRVDVEEVGLAPRYAFDLTLERACRVFSPLLAALTTRRFHFYELRAETTSTE